MKKYAIEKSDEAWRQELDDLAFRVLRQKGTEHPYSGKYNDFYEEGTYVCGACSHPLFSSEHKFESSCGWPSFNEELASAAIEKKADYSHFMIRTEILCPNCGSHLGHLFDDGPPPTGKRYCMNSVSMNFIPKKS